MKTSIAVTLGDPAGIGPEIVVKSLRDLDSFENVFNVVVVGEKLSFERALAEARLPNDYKSVTTLTTEVLDEPKIFLDLANLDSNVEYGQEDANAGCAAGEFIETSVDLCKRGIVDAMCTAPINKVSFAAGGYDFPGHTEFLAHLTNTNDYEMSFFAGSMCVVLLTRHLPISQALREVTKERVLKLIRFTDRELTSLLGKKPRIAVAGLNPHASDGGLFGDEEERFIAPAVSEASEEGIDVTGPHSPDTVFLRGYKGEFDSVIALYHDQATIPVKCLSFGEGVNVTLGLPIIRTSVDHGTAFEIAGKDVAEFGSMKTAIELAAKLSRSRKN